MFPLCEQSLIGTILEGTKNHYSGLLVSIIKGIVQGVGKQGHSLSSQETHCPKADLRPMPGLQKDPMAQIHLEACRGFRG